MDPHIIGAIKYYAIQCKPKGYLIKNAMTCVDTDFDDYWVLLNKVFFFLKWTLTSLMQ